MKKVLLLLIFILSIFIFIYSHDHKSITQITFVNSVGLEYNSKTNEYTMYFFILNNYTIAQSGNSPSFTNTHSYTAFATDKDILSAENKIRNNSNTKFDLTHIRSLILHDNFFEDDNVLKLYYYFQNNIKYNHSFEIYTTKDNLSDIYKLENFSEVSGYYTILVNTQNNIPVKHVRYNDFCNDLLIKDYTVYYHRIKINEGVVNDSDKKYVTLEYDGVSFIDEEYKLNSFKYQNLKGIGYLTTKINRTFLINHKDKEFIFSPNKFKISYKVEKNELKVKIKVNGYFLNSYNLNNQELKAIIEDEIKKELELMFITLSSYDIDIYNINYRYHNKYDYHNIKTSYIFDIVLTK